MSLHVLILSPELAPITGTGDLAVAEALRCRGLTHAGIDLTVAVPRAVDRDPERLGQARRLDPLRLADGGAELTVYEGVLPSGRGQLFTVDDPDRARDPGRWVRAALTLADRRDRWPDLIHPRSGVLLGAGADDVVVPGSEWGQPVEVAELPAARTRPVLFVDQPDQPPGIDEWRWRPDGDPLAAKPAAKQRARKRWGLRPRRTPLLLLLPPVDPDLLPAADVATLAELPLQLVAAGAPDALGVVRALADSHPDRVARIDAAELPLAVAAADLLLLPHPPPTRGTSDLFAAAFGAIPIAPRIAPYSSQLVEVEPVTATGSGFLFTGGAIPAVRRALALFDRPEALAAVRRSATRLDLSWQTVGLRYRERYLTALREHRARS